MTSPKKVRCLHHVAVQTAHFAQSLRFYIDVIGAELLTQRPFKRRDMAWLRIGDIRIELFSARTGDRLAEWTDSLPGPVHLAFCVDDLDAFLNHATSLGAELHPSHPEPFIPPAPGAGRMAYLLGPDGEEVEVREADKAEQHSS